MTFLTPLGLLGLLGIAVLILIYIIRPNYQQKLISTTFVWKLSLKYKKKKIPISKLRNFLIILCQILILTASALILAQPNQVLKAQVEEAEVIIIIDSSASMRTVYNEETRFERAVRGAIDLAETTFDNNGIVSVILADGSAEYFCTRVTAENRTQVLADLEGLLDDGMECAYGEADLNGAIAICEQVLDENPDAQIHLYTDQQYSYVPKGITYVPVSVEGEWNAAIVDAYVEMEYNYYMFIVEVACYGADKEIEVELSLSNVNATDSEDVGESLSFSESVVCSSDETKKIVFVNEDQYDNDPERFDMSFDAIYTLMETERVFSYAQIHVSLNEQDSFVEDNNFDIYNGQKEVLRIQYASSKPNSFFSSALTTLRTIYKDYYDIQITQVKAGIEPALEGFDFYVFEHAMPEVMPTDGVVLLANPNSAPTGSGLFVHNEVDFRKQSLALTEEESHQILENVTADNITISRYVKISYEGVYKTLMTCDSQPMLSIKDEPDSKVIVMAFSLHYSNLPILLDFPLLIKNVFDYYFPTTLEANAFEVNERVSINARGEELTVTGYDFEKTFVEFPAYFTVSNPGTYVLTQTTFTGKEIQEKIYVKVPSAESDIFAEGEGLTDPYTEKDRSEFFKDLMFYIAAAMVAILFLEWWLSSRDTM